MTEPDEMDDFIGERRAEPGVGEGGRWARCNFDGRPLHPDDEETLDTFREWLALPAERRLDPEWHEFLGIKPGE